MAAALGWPVSVATETTTIAAPRCNNVAAGLSYAGTYFNTNGGDVAAACGTYGAACACLCPSQAYSPAQRARIIDPGARPAASGSPVCPSPGFWASSQVCCPFSRPCAASRTRPAAAPARLHAGPCRSQHHHPSPGHPPTSISTLLTRASAVRASFLPFPCTLCAGLVRRLQRPLRLRGRLEGRQVQRAPWPQRGRRRRRRFGRPDGRWRPRARPFGRLRRPSGAAAEQRQQQH